VIAYARFELIPNLRDARFLFFLVVMPVLLFVVYSGLANGQQNGLPAAVALMVNMAAYAAMGSALYAVGPPLAHERLNGWIRQLRVTPLRDRVWITAKLVQGAVLVLPGVAAVCVVAVTAHHVVLSPQRWGLLLVVMLIGSLPFSILGLLLGQALAGQSCNTGTLLTSIGLGLNGGVFLPHAALPTFLHRVGPYIPTYWLAQYGDHAAGSPGRLDPYGLVTIVAWAGAACVGVLALRRTDASAS
jgi:ABC-2 type transport system permease protein